MKNFSRDGSLIAPILPAFVQEQLVILKTDIQKVQSKWPKAFISQGEKGVTSIYDCYPLLFLDLFPVLSADDVAFLTKAARLFATSIFVGDKLIDEHAKLNRSNIMTFTLSIHALQIEALHSLCQELPANTKFWERLKDYTRDYIDACVAENLFVTNQRPWADYSETVAMEIAWGKSGVSRSVVAGLVELGGNDEMLDALICSIDHYNVATQLLDDISDWREDLVANRPSLLTTLALKDKPDFTQIRDPEKWMLNFARTLHYKGYTSHVIELASQALQTSTESVQHLPDMLWKDAVAFLKTETNALLRDFNRIINRNLKLKQKKATVQLPRPDFDGRWMEVGNQGLIYLLNQWKLGYGEARHVMKFPSFMGFSAESEFHEGDIFQRALITDTFLDVNQYLGNILPDVVNQEANYLVSSRLKSDLGGWSYFPTLPELPPDADDLAQIMQVLVRADNKSAIEKYCLKPLECLLADGIYPDGSFETWIIPKNKHSLHQQLQARWAETEWGTGPDCDVIANLLFALYLYDAEKFHQEIETGAIYLIENQRPEGHWPQSWYFGHHYGVFVSLRLLTKVMPQEDSIAKAQHLIYSTQNDDGGWGMQNKSNALSTALSLLALAEIAQFTDVLNSSIDRALTFLHQLIQFDGGFDNFPLIQMPIGRAKKDVTKLLLHGSRTLTTSFVVKAMIAWQAIEDKQEQRSCII